MSPLLTTNNVRMAVLGVTGLAVAVVLWGVMRVVMAGNPSPVAPAESAVQAAELAYRASLAEEDAEMTERPLYWHGRQRELAGAGSNAPKQEKVAPNNALNKATLTAVMKAGDSTVVIVRVGNESHRVAVGENLLGWKLASVTPTGDRVQFKKGARNHPLVLEHAFPRNAPKPGVAQRRARAQANQAKAAPKDQPPEQAEAPDNNRDE